jgi:opacity protein-like surface antigen
MKKILLAASIALLSVSAIFAVSVQSNQLSKAQKINWKEGKDIAYCQLKIVKYVSGRSYWIFDIQSRKILEFSGLGSYKKPRLDVGRTVLSNCKMVKGILIVEHSLSTNDFIVDNEGISESVMDWTMIGNSIVDQYHDQPYSHEVKPSFWASLFGS